MECPTWISVYGAGGRDLVRKLPGLCKGSDGAAALAFDKEDNAYWADYFNGAVLVFAPGKVKPSYTIAWGAPEPYSLAVDGSDRLYVANLGPTPIGYAQSSVSVYASGKAIPSYAITQGITYPTYLTVAASGELFVVNCAACDYQYYSYYHTSNVAIYAPGEKSPSRVLYRGINDPDALALDGSGNLYVANECTSSSCARGSVTEYGPKSNAPSLTITKGFTIPRALTVDGEGNLYVSGVVDVVEFAKGETTPSRTIAIKDCSANALTVDSADNLYVLLTSCHARTPLGAIAVYAPGKTTPAYTVTKGIDEPKNFATAP